MVNKYSSYPPKEPPPPPPPFSVIPGMDPRADWLFAPGRQDFLIDGDATRIPYAIKVPNDEAVAVLRQLLDIFIEDSKDEKTSFFFQVNVDSLDDLKPDEFVTGFAPRAFFEALRERNGIVEQFSMIEGKEIKISLPMGLKADTQPPLGIPSPRLDPAIALPDGGAWPEDTVVVAIIDDGIGIAHERFRDRNDRTRIQCFWRQDGPYDDALSTVYYGREICKHTDIVNGKIGIDDLLQASKVGGAIDEDLFYGKAETTNFARPCHKSTAWRLAHGTHVLDLAAGENSRSAAANAENRPIIAVQLPVATTADPSGTTLDDYAIDAVNYILERVDAMSALAGRPLPVVINFSYGLIAGPHDGTSCLERFLDDRIDSRPDQLRIVLPAGNSHLSRTHAEIRFEDAATPEALRLRLQPDDQRPSFVEIWMPCDNANPGPRTLSRVEIEVTAPDAAKTKASLDEVSTPSSVKLESGSKEFGTLDYQFEPMHTKRGRFLLSLQPTVRQRPTDPPKQGEEDPADLIAPHGVWTISLKSQTTPPAEPIQIWIERDGKLHGYPRTGRQAYFDEPSYRRYDAQGRRIEEDGHAEQAASPSHVKRAGLINGIATGEKVIVAGGFQGTQDKVADYSAGGPTTDACGSSPSPDPDTAPRKPDAVLISDRSEIRYGVLAAGTRSGSQVAINGTSVAAPQLARWVADDLAAGGRGDRTAVQGKAIADDPGDPLPPNHRGGWGRVKIIEGLPIVEVDR